MEIKGGGAFLGRNCNIYNVDNVSEKRGGCYVVNCLEWKRWLTKVSNIHVYMYWFCLYAGYCVSWLKNYHDAFFNVCTLTIWLNV